MIQKWMSKEWVECVARMSGNMKEGWTDRAKVGVREKRENKTWEEGERGGRNKHKNETERAGLEILSSDTEQSEELAKTEHPDSATAYYLTFL